MPLRESAVFFVDRAEFDWRRDGGSGCRGLGCSRGGEEVEKSVGLFRRRGWGDSGESWGRVAFKDENDPRGSKGT